MNKLPIDIFAESIKETHKTLREHEQHLSDLFDKILVWIIGLSTGSIVLIFSSFDKLKFVNSSTINVTIILLITSIMAGLLGRILFAVATYLSYSLADRFDYELKLLQFPNTPRKLDGNETSEMIHYFILEDFKTDIQTLLENKRNATQNTRNQVDEQSRKFYKEYSAAYMQCVQEAINIIGEKMVISFGFRKNYFKNKKQRNNRIPGIIARTLTTFSYFLYFLCAIAFGSSILYFTTLYLQTAK